MKIWVNICFYYVESRLENFRKLIDNLSNIPNTKITIHSNVNFDMDLDIQVVETQDPQHYTWEHKKNIPEFLQSDYTHFAYLEGNIQVTQQTFEYWIQKRKLFQDNGHNFIPAIHRIQKDEEGEIYSLDSIHNQSNCHKITIEDQTFVFLSEPYQGMFIMDKQLAQEHIESEYYSLGQKFSYGLRESANLGNIYINIPSGLQHRSALPLNIPNECMVEHFGTNYQSDPNSPHAKIKIKDLF